MDHLQILYSTLLFKAGVFKDFIAAKIVEVEQENPRGMVLDNMAYSMLIYTT